MAESTPFELPRDRHLLAPGRKRILSLDGGGVRGVLSVAFLERIEALLAEDAGRPVRLCDHFDLIGGTSTGALIAAGLALGLSAQDLRGFYVEAAPRIFRQSRLRMFGVLEPRFDARPLEAEIHRVVGGRHLDSADIQTGLAIISKRMDTNSTWVLSNNPRAPYWEDQPGGAIGNRHFPLAAVVRASTAAPHYFAPELIQIVAGERPGLFVDGGVTPYKNPTLPLLMQALMAPHGLNWQAGADHLQIISIGTGDRRERMPPGKAPPRTSAGVALQALVGALSDSSVASLTLLHWLSGTRALWPVNSEIGDLGTVVPPFGQPLFGFRRYDAHLEADWLSEELGIRVDARELKALARLDQPAAVPRLYEIGQKAAAKFIRAEDFRADTSGCGAPA
ncbi:MAG: patatin-like phospholipase family protein [Hyphomicrobiales bacterium]|nr:patatin-like phospholipase family protein [Hyphomicrobiales bacterium]